MRDVTFLPGMSRVSFDSPFLSPLFFCVHIPVALSACHFSAHGPFFFVFTDNSAILVKTIRVIRLRLVRGRLFCALVEQLGAAIRMIWHFYLLLFICIMV